MSRDDRLDDLRRTVARLEEAVLDSDGATSPDARRSALTGDADEPAVARYLGLVGRHAYRITDADLEAVRAAGLDDDAIFELTVAAALGAAGRRLRAGLALLER
jgi:alkylhydroperoxidase family enzyme